MGNTLTLPVDGWTLEVKVRDDGLQIAIITDSSPPTSHYVRLGTIGAAALRDYLHMNLPISA